MPVSHVVLVWDVPHFHLWLCSYYAAVGVTNGNEALTTKPAAGLSPRRDSNMMATFCHARIIKIRDACFLGKLRSYDSNRFTKTCLITVRRPLDYEARMLLCRSCHNSPYGSIR